MNDPQRDYWTECIETAFEDCDIDATLEQIEAVAGDVEASHDNYGLALYQPSGDHRDTEIAKLKKALAEERAKVPCSECGGRGRIITQGPVHSSNSECYVCDGEGMVA